MQSWRRIYHPAYLKLRSDYDSRTRAWIEVKEDLVCANPLAWPPLKGTGFIRRYKGGKLRILYALSTERPDLWEDPPEGSELAFLHFDMRDERTYKEALTFLRRNRLID